MNESLRIFRWAAIHSYRFRHCLVQMPLSLAVRRMSSYRGRVFSLEIAFKPPSIYIPYELRQEYATATKQPSVDLFDDIPF